MQEVTVALTRSEESPQTFRLKADNLEDYIHGILALGWIPKDMWKINDTRGVRFVGEDDPTDNLDISVTDV